MRYVTYLNKVEQLVSKEAVTRAKAYRDNDNKDGLSLPKLYDLLKRNDEKKE
jgi:hypothetical protein